MSRDTLVLLSQLLSQVTLGSIAPGMEETVLTAKRELAEALAAADEQPGAAPLQAVESTG